MCPVLLILLRVWYVHIPIRRAWRCTGQHHTYIISKQQQAAEEVYSTIYYHDSTAHTSTTIIRVRTQQEEKEHVRTSRSSYIDIMLCTVYEEPAEEKKGTYFYFALSPSVMPERRDGAGPLSLSTERSAQPYKHFRGPKRLGPWAYSATTRSGGLETFP